MQVEVAHAGILAHSGGRDYDEVVIPAVVLAAGLSARMGRLKAALPVDDRDTFLTRIVRTFHAAGVERVIVVLGHQASRVQRLLEDAGLRPDVVVNPVYEQGQLSSLLAGLAAAEAMGAEAMLLMLVDAPMVSPDTVRAVVARFRQTHAPVVRPVRGPEHGHPVLIGRSLFGALREADPAYGAKPIVRGYVSEAGDVAVEDPGAFMDIDTPDAYRRAFGHPVPSEP